MDDIEQHVAPAAAEEPPEEGEPQFAPPAAEEEIQQQQQQAENQPPQNLEIEEVGEDDPPQQQLAWSAPESLTDIFEEMVEGRRRPRTGNVPRVKRDPPQPEPPRYLEGFKDEEDNNYTTEELIGTAYLGAILVYRASYRAYETLPVQSLFVAAKAIRTDQESRALTDLRERLERNALVPDHPNVLGINKSFTYQDNFCVTFPLMHFGSLRSLKMTTFPNGMPEDCIIIALREVLKGLQFIHENGQVHKEIDAGRIYFSQVPEIKLGFSASIYDHGGPNQGQPPSSSDFPIANYYSWAAAPEVYDDYRSLDTEKSDIWNIGMTAVELAYGKIRFHSRGEVDMLLDEMRKWKQLPKTKDFFYRQPVLGPAMFSNKAKFKALVKKWTPAAWKSRKFSREFESMVLKCVNLDREKRPTAHELLTSKVFQKMNKDVGYFLDVVQKKTK